MTEIYLELFLKFILPLLATTFMFVCLTLHTKYDELLRPLIGKMLFKKPMLRANLDAEDLFSKGNHNHRCKTTAEVNYSHDRLTEFIRKKSWFRKHDIRWLNRYYSSYFDQIRYYETYERNKKFGRKEENKPKSEWREVLGLSQSEKDPKVIKQAYRIRVSKDHPDKGGTGRRMPELNKALDAARNELNFV